MTALLTAVLVMAAVAMTRRYATRRAHAAVAQRLTLGPDGIITGATPIELRAEGGHAVLMLHGFGDTPQTLEQLAAYIHAQGWTVRVPLLPGHGRTLRAFAASRASEWIEFARGELASLRSQYDSVALVGLSMGGSLATIVAAETPELAALVLLAPYLSMPSRLRRAARAHHVLGVLLPYMRGASDRSIRDPSAAQRNLAYGFTTPRLVFELARVVDRARSAAPSVGAPTLVIQSRQDNRIPPDAAEGAFGLFTAHERDLVWTEGNGHIITVDYGYQAVFAAVTEWIRNHFADVQLPGTRRASSVPQTP